MDLVFLVLNHHVLSDSHVFTDGEMPYRFKKKVDPSLPRARFVVPCKGFKDTRYGTCPLRELCLNRACLFDLMGLDALSP